MLVLTFSSHDSFFIEESFFQVLKVEKSTGWVLRSQYGDHYRLVPEQLVTLHPQCKAMLIATNGANEIRIGFEAPRDVAIVRSAVKSNDDFTERLSTPHASEATIDRLLEEEFIINRDFTSKVVRHCFGNEFSLVEDIKAFRSAVQNGVGAGETDVLLTFQALGKTYALLIENKITASKQDFQPERYIERGISGLCGGLWDAFETCLIAPDQYISTRKSDDYYHNYLSYEKIVEFLQLTVSDPGRCGYRVRHFQDAILKRGQYEPLPNRPEAEDFLEELRKLASQACPSLKMFRHSRPSGSIMWFHFRSNSCPKSVQLIIQQRAVVAEFQLSEWDLTDHLPALEHEGYEFKTASQSCTIRKAIDAINCMEPLSGQSDNLNRAFQYLNDLQHFVEATILNQPEKASEQV